jgi:hypothetical protein
MAEAESLKAALDVLKSRLQTKIEEAQRLEMMIRELESEASGQPAEPGDSAASAYLGTLLPAAPSSQQGTRDVEIRPDEFFGMSHGDAAKAYLKRMGRAVLTEDLLEALKKGGCRIGGANPKKGLYIALVRNVREFVPVGNGYIGLREFYPAKKLGRPKETKSSARKGKQDKPARKTARKRS